MLQNVPTYESVKVMKRPFSMNTLMIVLSVLSSILSLECSQRLVSSLSYTLIGEYVVVTFTYAHLRFISSFILSSNHIVTSFINLAYFVFILLTPLHECSFHHMPMHLAIQYVSHFYLTILGLHHFITYVLISLTFKRMLDL